MCFIKFQKRPACIQKAINRCTVGYKKSLETIFLSSSKNRCNASWVVFSNLLTICRKKAESFFKSSMKCSHATLLPTPSLHVRHSNPMPVTDILQYFLWFELWIVSNACFYRPSYPTY
ncbi:hypothetical protein OIU79_023980 [Salix purpurea]|uniref:Uncharacterized protein n=1 Tax=Salix purpurea TaxID=77065 RepID=A0A9Q0WA02_SALPP|nr:hypothetical protein OIU79_023980 [Salix purpurea]